MQNILFRANSSSSIGDYQFKNYRILINKEQKIALAFRNKNREWMINKAQSLYKIGGS